MPGQGNHKPSADVQTAFLQNKTQPASVELERAVLSAMLRDPEFCIPTAVSMFGNQAEVFFTATHRELFKAILKISESQSEKQKSQQKCFVEKNKCICKKKLQKYGRNGIIALKNCG